MTNLNWLKAIVATIHGKAVADLTINGIDMFLVAANNVQRKAQLSHNFEFTRVNATLSIDGMVGTPISQAKIVDASNEEVKVTGTGSPDLDGVYYRSGVWGEYSLYILDSTTVEGFIFFNTTAASFVLSATLTNAALTDFWKPAVAQTTPLGSYVAQGATTGPAVVGEQGYAQWAGVREITALTRTMASGRLVPLDFTRSDIPIERDRATRELTDNFGPWDRVPSDADILNFYGNSTIIQRNKSLFIYPTPTSQVSNPAVSVQIEGFAWLAPYSSVGNSSDSPQDFLVEQGFEFMQWRCVEELNFIFKTFVARTEGNLTLQDVQLKVKEAYQALLDWDDFMVDSNATRSR